ncbi:MAG: thioether cross-link-forming SCIFF peptide maturase [Eubacteriales bacterium]|nr:thioether cross-link-forming SCIFF peptide maturase [Eubacteriales bacterium]
MIHQYKLNGYNIVLDVYSGGVHAVDELAYDAIGMLAQGIGEEEAMLRLSERYVGTRLPGWDLPVTDQDIADTFDDIDELRVQGRLFTEDTYADKAFDFKNRSTVVKALCLHVAHTCNLNCSYCFAAQGKFHGQAGLMSAETAKRAIDFLVENSGTRRNLEVDFFGGEPLMNFEVCKETVAYARSIEKAADKNFRFTLTTNGIGVTDEVIEWANRECHNVVLSLDGRKEVNDRFRKDIRGEGSYDRIVPKFQEFVRRRGGRGYYMRGTFTHYNPDFTNDLFHMADDLGFAELSMEPVVAATDDPCALTKEDLPVLFEQYELLAKDMLRREKEGKPITFYHYMLDLEHGPCIYKRISGCGSGTEYMAVTPWGDLYPCHQFVGDENYKLGDIWNGVTRTDLRDEFKLCNVYAREGCKDCWARLYCSGGCAANALHATGDIHGVYEYGCEVFRKRIECAVMMQVAKSLDPELAQAGAQREAAAQEACEEDCGGCE